MKLTTFFAIAFALLLGTGFFFAARQFGWFERTAVAKEAPPPAKQQAVMILVAAENLFDGIVITSPKQVTVREATSSEIRDRQTNGARYLAATPSAAMMRVPLKPISAGTPLLEDDFEPLVIPPGSEGRIGLGMRAVNVALPKNRCVGGLVRAGDHVDVMLTTKTFPQGEPESAIFRTAVIARNVRVIIKRNSLYKTFAPNPDDKPVDFTLELNPYRAALLEFAQQKGDLAIVSTPTPQQKVAAGQFSDPTSKEYAEEDERVQGIIDSTYVVTDVDLARIFQIKAPTPKQQVAPTVVRHISGINLSSATIVGPGGNGGAAIGGGAYNEPPRTMFMQPTAPTDPKSCPTCGKPPKRN